MARNGVGVFQRLYDWVTDANAGTNILAARMDAEFDGVADEISNSIAADGQTTITNHIPFATKRITNLGNPVNAQDGATKAYVDASAGTTSDFRLTNSADSADDNELVIQKNRANAIVEYADGIGTVRFRGWDGSGYINAARIAAVVTSAGSGTVGADLEFGTTASGGANSLTRYRITSAGALEHNQTQAGVTYGGQLREDVVNAAGLSDATNAINASYGKAQGVSVFDATTGKPLWATGSGATDTWVDATGTTVYTPS